jgi:4-amino-4-deoxy-L-arabinose transferase-like glycosyltransferase
MRIQQHSIRVRLRRLIKQQRRLSQGVLIAALVLRVGVAFAFPARVVRTDADGYLAGAQRLLVGDGYAYGDGLDLAVPPLYSIFLAGVFAVLGPSLLAVRLVQASLAVASYGLTYLVANGLFREEVALVALLLSAFYPALIPWHGFLLTETLYTLTITSFFLFLYRLSRRLTWYDAVGCGVSLGLSLLTREMLLLYPLLLLPLLFVKSRPSTLFRHAVIVLASASLVLLPWLWRNHKLTGHVVYTSRVSYVLYRVTGKGYLSPKYAAVVNGESAPPSKAELARWEKYGNLSENLDLGFVLSQPGTFARRMFNRFVEYWFHPNGLWSLPEVFIVRALYVAGHAVLIMLAGLGIGLTFMARRWSAWGLIAVLLYITGLNLTTYGPNPRYNLPFLPIVFIFTARGTLKVIDWLSGRKRRQGA